MSGSWSGSAPRNCASHSSSLSSPADAAASPPDDDSGDSRAHNFDPDDGSGAWSTGSDGDSPDSALLGAGSGDEISHACGAEVELPGSADGTAGDSHDRAPAGDSGVSHDAGRDGSGSDDAGPADADSQGSGSDDATSDRHEAGPSGSDADGGPQEAAEAFQPAPEPSR
ncbi:MAG TPA: hypothetical protein VI357_18480 [Mycobacteriales bacterium]